MLHRNLLCSKCLRTGTGCVPRASNIMLNHSFMMSKISLSKKVTSELYCIYNSTVFLFTWLTDQTQKKWKDTIQCSFLLIVCPHIQETEAWVDRMLDSNANVISLFPAQFNTFLKFHSGEVNVQSFARQRIFFFFTQWKYDFKRLVLHCLDVDQYIRSADSICSRLVLFCLLYDLKQEEFICTFSLYYT